MEGGDELTKENSTDNADMTLEEHWKGFIPVQLELAPTSISSPTLPPAIHALVPRISYLHVGLSQAISRLHPFAPVISTMLGSKGVIQATEPSVGEQASENEIAASDTSTTPSLSTDEPSDTVHSCWFQDADTEAPLKWHLPISVLFDTRRDRSLPWRLLLHFTNYPVELLPFDSVQHIFQHSLKQALTIATGVTKKTAMQLNKESHQRIWQAITTADYSMFRRVDLPLTCTAAIPIRIVVVEDRGSLRTLQHHVKVDDSNISLATVLEQWLPDGMLCPPWSYRICGVDAYRELSGLSLQILWQHCRLADQFLYVVVGKKHYK